MFRRAIDRYIPRAAALAIVLICLAGGWSVASVAQFPSGSEFNSIEWELKNFPGKWLYLTGRFFRGGLSSEEEDEYVGRYVLLTAQIASLSRRGETGPELDRLSGERQEIENHAEAIIEGRLTALLEDEGLESSLPLFPHARLVFPPVDLELDETPDVLITSPRDRIELLEQRTLEPGLALAKIAAIESEIERDGETSALVDGLAGIALYPSIVAPRTSYQALIETSAHEWVHQYLSFRPLGLRYASSVELRTLNETVAEIAGIELGERFVERHPLPPDIEAPLEALASRGRPEAVDETLRSLRIEVGALLEGGRIEEAEALMEETRQELAEQGVFFRRINQAFFAFRSIYATDPASIDPIGEKLQSLRGETGSTGAFLRAAAGLEDAAGLDELLAELRGAGGTERR